MISFQTTTKAAATKYPFRDVSNVERNSRLKIGQDYRNKVSKLFSTKATFHRQANSRPHTSNYQSTRQFDEIDKRNASDPLYVTTYVQDMYQHFKSKECVGPSSVAHQPQVSGRMRAVLVDWLVDVHHQGRFAPETLYLAVNIMDRYLAQRIVFREQVQLVGATAFLIASKYEETVPIALADLVYLSQGSYTPQDILDFETELLQTLGYRITVPTAYTFLVRFLKAAHADDKIAQISNHILDGTLQDCSIMNRHLPSQLAAAAVFIARRTVGRTPWSPTLAKYAEYTHQEIAPIARKVLAAKASPCSRNLVAVEKKHARSRLESVAEVPFGCDDL